MIMAAYGKRARKPARPDGFVARGLSPEQRHALRGAVAAAQTRLGGHGPVSLAPRLAFPLQMGAFRRAAAKDGFER